MSASVKTQMRKAPAASAKHHKGRVKRGADGKHWRSKRISGKRATHYRWVRSGAPSCKPSSGDITACKECLAKGPLHSAKPTKKSGDDLMVLLDMLLDQFGLMRKPPKTTFQLLVGSLTEMQRTATKSINMKLKLLRQMVKVATGSTSAYDERASRLTDLAGRVTEKLSSATGMLSGYAIDATKKIYEYVVSSKWLLFALIVGLFTFLKRLCRQGRKSFAYMWASSVKSGTEYTMSMLASMLPSSVLSALTSAFDTVRSALVAPELLQKLYTPFIGLVSSFCGAKRKVFTRHYKLSKEQYFAAANAAYQTDGFSDMVKGFQAVHADEQVKAFLQESTKTMLVSIRGTVLELQDLAADTLIALNLLERSSHHKAVVRSFEEIIQKFPPIQFDYFITGHSLGGAEAAAIVRKYPFITAGIVFNAALQSKDIDDEAVTSRLTYIYVDGDLIDNLNSMARNLTLRADNTTTFRIKRADMTDEKQAGVLAYATATALNATGGEQHKLASFTNTTTFDESPAE